MHLDTEQALEQRLIARMRTYLEAGLVLDTELLDALYDSEFENVRVDQEGRTAVLTKRHFMDRFRMLKQSGQNIGDSVDDVTFPSAGLSGDLGSVVMRRVKDGEPVLYHFLWRLDASGAPTTLLREYTFERDLSRLLAMMAAAR
ncbi:hypothetical protein ABZ990_04665 [Streptomyces sp. NPDC046203]|uniref:hypothetical protein n=1 Tax=Streptomyces sp. NPDC046203 TaxID=3154602 RepID=UPI0033DFF362